METKQVIESKITALGGSSENPMCQPDVNHPVDSSSFTRLEAMYRERIPDVFKFFYKKYGPFSFNKNVG
jgi:hypothetical protein